MKVNLINSIDVIKNKKEVTRRSEKKLLVKKSLLFLFLEISVQADERVVMWVQKTKVLVELILKFYLFALPIFFVHHFFLFVPVSHLKFLKNFFFYFHSNCVHFHLIVLFNDFQVFRVFVAMLRFEARLFVFEEIS